MKKNLEEMQKRLHKKSELVKAFLVSEMGKEIMSMLEDEFYDCDMFDPDPHIAARNLGRRDVVYYLKQLERLDNGI